MSDRQSKRRSRGQFLPRVLCLEDRTVPTTFFVDPALSPAPTNPGDPVTFNAALPGQQVPGLAFAGTFTQWQAAQGNTAFKSFVEALKAANFNPGADTIRVAGSTTPIAVENTAGNVDPTSGALKITGDLTIQGSGQGATVLAPNTDTADELTAVLSAVGPALTVTDLTVEGAGRKIGFGFDIGDGTTATFDRVTIRNVQFNLGSIVEGTPISAFDSDPGDAAQVVLTVQNSTITNSGLHGIAFDGSDGTVSGTTITGRGFDAFTNAQNGVQIVGDSKVLITGSTISGNVGGGVSSGVAVAQDPVSKATPTVSLIGNTLTGNTIGLTAGTVAGDGSVVTAHFNNIAGNFQGVDSDQNTPGVSATSNYWGSPTGPFNATNNPGGTGNSVSDNVTFTPFLTGPTPVLSAPDEAAYLAAISTVGTAVSPAPGQIEPVLPPNPVLFQVVFAESVTGFDPADVSVVASPPGSTPVVAVTGTGTTYTVSVTGLTGFGEVAIQVPAGVAVTAAGFRNSASGVASVDFGTPPNTPPQISTIANQATQVGTATTPAAFTVTDTETPEAALIVTASSNNQAVVPDGAIVLGGAGANRTISATPIAEGVATITVTVTDGGGATASTSFTVTAAANTAPTISAIADQTAQVNTASTPGAFTVGDAQTPADQLTVTTSSSNPAVVPNANITLGGSGANRTVSVTPIAVGTATITVTVSDGTLSTSTTFTATGSATPVNTPPTISALANQSSAINTASTAQAFTIGDAQTPADQLTVTTSSSNQAVVPNVNINVGGTGANRTISFIPTNAGTATITVTVTDAGGLSTTGTFTATGTGQPPTNRTVRLGTEEFAAGPGAGGGPVVNYYNPDGTTKFSATVFAAGFSGGVRTAVGDFNGDGVPDVAVGTGPGSVTAVRVLDGTNPDNELFRIIPFEEAFTGGVFVAAGDVTGDGKADLVITPDQGGGPRARVFSGDGFGQVADFFGIDDPAFRGGARSAVSDVNGDGVADLLVAAGFGGGPRLAGFDGKSLSTGPVKLFADFFVFEQTLRNGVFVAGGDVNGDGFADIIVGGGPGGGPRVFAVSGKDILTNTQVQVANFFAGNTSSRGGIRVTAKDLDGDDKADIVVGAGEGAGSQLTAYAGSTIPADGTPPELFAFDAFPGFTNGIYVG
ncbi:MAG TPA: right-handed parallel beta-helix repeat-containing protein [Fimbriiglobus sp.]|nr:right-handed parallel beta-helix repeat-containing protein [Fimbriiglobus sp.]